MANIRNVTGHTANPWEASIADFFSNKNWEQQREGINPNTGEPMRAGNWYRPAGSVGSVGDIQNNVTLRKGPFPYEPLTVPRVEVEPAAQVDGPLSGGFEPLNDVPQSPPGSDSGPGMVDKVVEVGSDSARAIADMYRSKVAGPAYNAGFNYGPEVVDGVRQFQDGIQRLASGATTAIREKAAGGAIQDFLKQYDEGFRGTQDNIESWAAGGGLNPIINAFNQFQRGTQRRSSEMSTGIHDWAANRGVQKLGTSFMDVLKYLRKAGAI